MIASFKVSNFKGFNEEVTFNFKETNGYTFNSECIRNGLVNSALIYGHNGVGKSNLGMALFDIIGHVTDKYIYEKEYQTSTYLNALNGKSLAKFSYEFKFNDDFVIYNYAKSDVRTAIEEELIINGTQVAYINREVSEEATIALKGAETLKREITNENLSLIKYIRNNANLENNTENNVLHEFYEFVDRMLFFRSLNNNMYLGLQTGIEMLQDNIIKNGKVKELESFLNNAGIECKLEINKETEKEIIVFDFNGKSLPLFDVASTGTKSLVLFFYWRQHILEQGRVSFLFIDEFDAFYHHELSALIVEELKKSGVQFVLTSHNTSIITNDLMRPDCYFLMKKDSIMSLAKRTQKELREAHNIEKMYKAGTFDV